MRGDCGCNPLHAGPDDAVSGVLTLVAVLAYVHRVPQVAGHAEPVLAFMLAYLSLRRPGRVCRWIAYGGAAVRPRCNVGGSRSAAAVTVSQHRPEADSGACSDVLRHDGTLEALWRCVVEGSTVWLLLAQTQSRPLNLTAIRDAGQFGEYVINFWTQSILYFELAFPILIWNRLARPLLVALGVLIWVAITLATGQLLFGLTMLVANLAYLPVEFFERDGVAGRRHQLQCPRRPVDRATRTPVGCVKRTVESHYRSNGVLRCASHTLRESPMPRRNILLILVVAAASWVCYQRAARNRYAGTLSEVMNVVANRYINEVEPRTLFEARWMALSAN